jgi:uncharacterized repeat protein (TIGR03803 family)
VRSRLSLELLEGRVVPSTLTVLAAFHGADGSTPNGGLIEDSSGNLFGTTELRGAYGDGTVFEVAAGSGTPAPATSFNWIPRMIGSSGE